MTTANGEPDAVLDALLDGLYRGPRENFVSERNAAAASLKAAGRGEDAAVVKAQTKPSVTAWVVNQLWWHHREAMAVLLDAGRRQALAVQQAAGPAEQAAAGQARRRAVDRLLQTATSILRSAGNAAGTSALRRVTTTLEALAVMALQPDPPPIGRLTGDLQPPGFGALAGLGTGFDALPPPLTVPEPKPPARPSAAEQAYAAAEQAVTQAQQAQVLARQRTEAAARAMDDAAHEAQQQRQATDEAIAEHERAHAEAERARHIAETAEKRALAARAEAARRDEALLAAHQTVTERDQALRRAEDALAVARAQLSALRTPE